LRELELHEQHLCGDNCSRRALLRRSGLRELELYQ